MYLRLQALYLLGQGLPGSAFAFGSGHLAPSLFHLGERGAERIEASFGHPFLIDGLLEHLDVLLYAIPEVRLLNGEFRFAFGVLCGRDRPAGETFLQGFARRTQSAQGVDVFLDVDG